MLTVKVAKTKEGTIKSQVEEKVDVSAIKKIHDTYISEENIKLHTLVSDSIVMRHKDPLLIESALDVLGKAIINRIKVYTWQIDGTKEFWVYDKGIYIPEGLCHLEIETKNILGPIFSDDLFRKMLSKIRSSTYIKKEDFIYRALNHRYEINVNNGIVRINPETYEVRLDRHTSNDIFLWKLNVDYNIESRCIEIDKFFEDTLAEPSDRAALDEALGTTLQPNEITKKAVVLYGEPDTAKTTTGNLILAFLGKNNCANLTLQQITEKDFLVSYLFGKIANIAGDLSAEAIKNIDIFKRITGGDQLAGDRKYKTVVSFDNQAKMFFNMNQLPRIYNADKATWNRMMPFKYVRMFVNKDVFDKLSIKEKEIHGIKDPHILDKLTTPTELSGLLNRAIDGLIRYMKFGKFSYTKGVDEYSREWIRLSDSFMAFCIDNVEHGNADEYISRKDLANRYSKYCKEHNVKSVGDKSIKATLSSEYGVYVEGYSHIRGTDERCWEGIKWKPFKDGTLNG